MNIAVSPEVLRQHEANKAVKARLRANPWTPKLIEAPKKKIQEKPRTKAVFKGVPYYWHVKAYNHHQSLLNPEHEAEQTVSMLDIRDIQHIVIDNQWQLGGIRSEAHSVSINDIKSRKRHRKITLPRQVAMFISRKKCGHSFPVIGKHFGRRDHTTVLHAYEKILKAILEKKLLMNGEPFTIDRIGEI